MSRKIASLGRYKFGECGFIDCDTGNIISPVFDGVITYCSVVIVGYNE